MPNVAYMESRDYHEQDEKIQDLLELAAPALDHETRRFLKIQKRRRETLKRIESATGMKFRVANDNDVESNVAAFVATADKKGYMVEHTLDHADWALYAARHEAQHIHNSVFDVDLERNMSEEQITVLREIVGNEFGDIADVNLVEGFNDLLTARKHGANDNSGYKDQEIPAAEKLEEICQREIGESLASAFDKGNMLYFYELLRRTCDIVRVKKFLAIAGPIC